MEVRNCRSCGTLFNYIGGSPVCPRCREALEEKFGQVKEYIRDNPGANIQQVSEDNDVSTQQIRQWVREERLEFSKDSAVTISCESCGKQIRTGRYCEECKRKVTNDLSQAYAPKGRLVEEPKKNLTDSNKMRFLNK